MTLCCLALLTYYTRNQLLFERKFVPQCRLVEVKRVVQVGQRAIVELVEDPDVVDQRLKRFQDCWKFQKSVNLSEYKDFVKNKKLIN
jgi:hypothetical protein